MGEGKKGLRACGHTHISAYNSGVWDSLTPFISWLPILVVLLLLSPFSLSVRYKAILVDDPNATSFQLMVPSILNAAAIGIFSVIYQKVRALVRLSIKLLVFHRPHVSHVSQ